MKFTNNVHTVYQNWTNKQISTHLKGRSEARHAPGKTWPTAADILVSTKKIKLVMKQKLKRRDLCCAYGLSLARQIAAIKGKKFARLDNPPTHMPACLHTKNKFWTYYMMSPISFLSF